MAKKEFNRILKSKSEQHFLRKFKIFLIFSQMFCSSSTYIQNIKLTPEGSKRSGCYAFRSISFLVIHFIWCIIIFGCILYSAYFSIMTGFCIVSTVEMTFYILGISINVTNAALIIIGIFWYRHMYENFITRITDIEHKILTYLNIADVEINVKPENELILLASVITISFILNAIISYLQETPIQAYVFDLFANFLPNFMTSLAFLQYWMLLFLVELKFRQVNSIMAKLSSGYKQDDRLISASHMLSEEMHGYNKAQKDNVHSILNSIRMIFSELDIFTGDVTSMFSVLILLNFTGSYVVLSYYIFKLYSIFESSHGHSHGQNYFSAIYFCFWIIMRGTQVFLVLSVNNGIVKEKANTALILNKIEFKSSKTEVSVNRFLLQLMVNNRVQTACGVIELDLMFSGAVLTTVSVLVTFVIQMDLGRIPEVKLNTN